jgi:antitoxin ParD1/3/4
MHVSLTPELERLVLSQVESGLCNSASEVVREGLRLLARQNRIEALRLQAFEAEVAAALADIDGGRYDEFSNVDDLEAALTTLRDDALSATTHR